MLFLQENTNKAVIADFWVDRADDSTNAFAAATFFNGYASAIGYFVFPFVARRGMVNTVVVSSLFGLVCYLFAFRAQEVKAVEMPEDEKKALLKRQYWEHRGTHIANPASAFNSGKQ